MNTYVNIKAAAEEMLRAHPSSNLYLLLDHSGLPGLHSKLSKSSLEWVSLFDCTLEENAIEVAPMLVLIGSSGNLKISRLFCEWIGEMGTYASAVMMMASPLSLAPLSKRLSDRLDVRLTEDMPAMLRFFDPRIFESLQKVLNAEQLASFLSPAEAWQYVDRGGLLVHIASNFNIEESFSVPLVLSQKQEDKLLNLSEVDQVLDLLQSTLPTIMATVKPAARHAYVVEKVELAKNLGVNSIFKLAIFVLGFLMEGEEFTKKSSWNSFLEKQKQGESELDGNILINQ